MAVPPTAPNGMIVTEAFVMIASGRLSRIPGKSPVAHPILPGLISPIQTPIANRLKNEASIAARFGKLHRQHDRDRQRP